LTDKTPEIVKIGTRGSELAMVQAEKVAIMLWKKFPDTDFQLVKIKTEGDIDRSTPLADMGGTGVFVKELEKAMLKGRIDIAVHSAKDLPAKLDDEFTIAAIPERFPVEDALICKGDYTIDTLPEKSTIATGSVRRRALLKHHRLDINFCNVRGNIDTRLRKLDNGEFDGIVLARAGLMRLKRDPSIHQILPADKFLPAPGQGAIALETLKANKIIIDTVDKINDPMLFAAVEAERSLLRRLNVGCSSAVCGYARWDRGRLNLSAGALDPDGKIFIRAEADCLSAEEAEKLGIRVAEKLLEQGAKELMENRD